MDQLCTGLTNVNLLVCLQVITLSSLGLPLTDQTLADTRVSLV